MTTTGTGYEYYAEALSRAGWEPLATSACGLTTVPVSYHIPFDGHWFCVRALHFRPGIQPLCTCTIDVPGIGHMAVHSEASERVAEELLQSIVSGYHWLCKV